MERTYWHKQTASTPLFPDLIWSRPENRQQAGKLLIIGGNGYEFKAPANAYGDALEAGVGNARVILPDTMRKVVSDIFPEATFAPSTHSGSFARAALGEFLEAASWSDGVLLAGNLGRNSETAILLESFAQKFSGQLTLTHDAADYFTANPLPLLERENSCLVISFSQLQRLAMAARWPMPFTFETDLLRLIENLHTFSAAYPNCQFISKHLDTMFVASDGLVSSTKMQKEQAIWRVHTAAQASVWWLQNPSKPFEALSTSLV